MEKTSKKGKIINTIVMIVEILIIIAGITFSIIVITDSKSTTDELGSGYNVTVVLTSSMDGNVKDQKINSFKAGDLLIIKALKEGEYKTLKEGDVVTFLGSINGKFQLITHRIVKIEPTEARVEFSTRGDAENEGEEKIYYEGDIVGVVKGVVPKLGYVINFFQKPTNFLLTVVLPLAALLIYNVAMFIRMIVQAKLKKVEEQSKKELEEMKSNMTQLDEEEIKKKAIEEYLQKMKETEGETNK